MNADNSRSNSTSPKAFSSSNIFREKQAQQAAAACDYIAELMLANKVGAVWITVNPKDGEPEAHIFWAPDDTPDRAHVRAVGDAFTKVYEEMRKKHFPEGEKYDSKTKEVAKG